MSRACCAHAGYCRSDPRLRLPPALEGGDRDRVVEQAGQGRQGRDLHLDLLVLRPPRHLAGRLGRERVDELGRIAGRGVVGDEAPPAVGGQAATSAKGPWGDEEFMRLVNHLKHRCEMYGAKIVTGKPVTSTMIDQQAPDKLILATGTSPDRSAFPDVTVTTSSVASM